MNHKSKQLLSFFKSNTKQYYDYVYEFVEAIGYDFICKETCGSFLRVYFFIDNRVVRYVVYMNNIKQFENYYNNYKITKRVLYKGDKQKEEDFVVGKRKFK